MLNDIISISMMQAVFKECKPRLSFKAMVLYQNVLNHHFSTLAEIHANLKEFKMAARDIPQYQKHLSTFTEMQAAGLVKVEPDGVLFLEVWQKHVSPRHFIKYDTIRSAKDFLEPMLSSTMLIDNIAVKSGVKSKDVVDMMNAFFDEQEALGKTYLNELECRKHFMSWCRQQPVKEKQTVKSKSAILGII